MPDPVELRPLPPREAIDYFRSKGLAPRDSRFDWRDIWREEHARSFVVAKAMQDDVLSDIRRELDRALSEGLTLEQFRKTLRPKLEAAGWWGTGIQTDPLTGQTREVQLGSAHRLRVIYDTNLRTSYAAGRWARIQRTKLAFPYLEYYQIQRPSKRDAHEPYHGLVLPVDHPVWERIYPPNGWFCACSVRQTNDRKLAREGKSVTTDFDLETVGYENRRTGETEQIPVGIDPGFDSNPGASWINIDDRHARSLIGPLGDREAVDRALVRELRARVQRDGEESLAVYALEGDERLRWLRARPGSGDRVVFSPELNDQLGSGGSNMVLIHSHISDSGPSLEDVNTMLDRPGLAEMAIVTSFGSIFRLARTDLSGTFSPRDFQRFRGLVLTELVKLLGDKTADPQVSLWFREIVLLGLSRMGVLRYAKSASGSHASMFAVPEFEALLEGVLDGILDQ